MDIDYLLVGQGIAGSVLSHQLMKEGCRVMVIGMPGLTVSSEVAAGLYNPVTGRKMVKTWLADQLFPHIETVYQEMEQLAGTHFLNPIPIFRPFTDIAELNDWQAKQGDPAYSAYIEYIYEKPHYEEYIHNPYGGILLKQSGWLEIPLMLQAWQRYLNRNNSYLQEEFDEQCLEIKGDSIKYREIRARKVIYCNGNQVLRSRYWNWVPLRPVKGEVLLVKAPVELDQIINRGVFFLPVGGGNYKVGSTYDQRDLSLEATEAARKDILERLSALIKMPVEVKGQAAGIRPATKDRRPVVGMHPESKTLAIFNGLGTKGVSLAPWCASLFVNNLLKKKELFSEVNIERFFSLYYS